jgi:hypothetical protein
VNELVREPALRVRDDLLDRLACRDEPLDVIGRRPADLAPADVLEPVERLKLRRLGEQIGGLL